MRINRVMALLVFCTLLLAVGGNGAAASKQKPAEKPGMTGTGELKGNQKPSFFLSDASCQSSCCWASCWGYEDCSVSCSSSGCSAQGGGESSSVTCGAS